MLENNLHNNYEKYKKWLLDFQKEIWFFNLKDLYPITGVTWSGKSRIINKLSLPSLFSYKCSEFPFEVRGKQISISQDKFNQMLCDWLLFDVYRENDKYYWYSIIDYYILKKEFNKVFIEISPQNYLSGLNYSYKKLIIIDPPKDQLNANLLQRIKERNYSEDTRIKIYSQQEKENKLIQNIINQNPQSIILNNLNSKGDELIKSFT